MKTFFRAASALLLCAGMGACATVTRGTTTNFTVASVPPGAAAKTTTGFACAATPCTFKMPRKKPFDLTVTKPGYKAATVHIDSKVAGAGVAGAAGNVVLGGGIGIVVDATSGAMNNLTPNPVTVTLEPETSASNQ